MKTDYALDVTLNLLPMPTKLADGLELIDIPFDISKFAPLPGPPLLQVQD